MADTFADYLSAGTTKGVGYRLVIEGCREQFVSDVSMECELADGRRRVRGLLPGSISINEQGRPGWSEVDISHGSLQIEETAGPFLGAAARAFTAWLGNANITWLAARLGYADTTATVQDASGIAIEDIIHIGSEAIRVDNIVGNVLTITRGMWGTTPQSFEIEATSVSGSEPRIIQVSTEPATYMGRRFWVHGHGIDEAAIELDAAGELLYRGVINADAELDGDVWSISVGSRMTLLDASIGSAAGASAALRGIYYPSQSPLDIFPERLSGADWGGTPTVGTPVRISGFFETREDFCAALTAAMEAMRVAMGWGGSFEARIETQATGREVWELFYTTDATPRYMRVTGGSPVDGDFRPWLGSAASQVTTVAASTSYRFAWEDRDPFGGVARFQRGYRGFPRASYVSWSSGLGGVGDTWPMNRWYLARVGGFPIGATMLIDPPLNGEEDLDAFTVAINGNDATGYVQASALTTDRPDWAASGEVQPTISIATRFNDLDGCNFAQFLAAVVDVAQDKANSGIVPFLTDDDIDLASWDAAVARAAGGDVWLTQRDYCFPKPKKFIDVFTMECRYYGLFPCLGADGRIAAKQLTPDVDTPALSIGPYQHAPSDGDFGKLQVSPDGVFATVKISEGYDPAEDEYSEEPYDYTDVGASSIYKSKAGGLEISPLVRCARGGIVNWESHLGRVAQLFHLYGARRYVYSIPVTLAMHGLRIGDGALLTIPQLPYVGRRGDIDAGLGLSVVRGMVIGRSWSYGTEPRGVLTFLVNGLDVAGYAPSGRVTDASGSTTSWTLTLKDDHYGPGGAILDAEFFEVGMRIELVEFDSDTPTTRLGTVTSRAGSVVGVLLDSSWAGIGGAAYDLEFAPSDQGITDAQKRYAFVANPGGRVVYVSGSRVAHFFA